MSNVLKSKILLGSLIVAAAFAGAMLLAVNNADAAYVHSTTLRQGSTGPQVMSLQSTLGGLVVDGAFGPRTKSAVMAFQSANGLVADGVVGPMTGATLAGAGPAVPVAGLPAGCTSTSGFSPVTGQSCSSASGVPGCMPGYAFSTVTGQSCTGAPSAPSTSLSGSANIDSITALSQYSNEQVAEGEQDAPILGKRIKMASTGDARLQQVRVTFIHGGGATSTRLERYATDVSVWLNGAEAGSQSATSFTRVTGGEYSGTIILDSSAVLMAGKDNDLVIAVSALSNIDGNDEGQDWDVNIESIRYLDGTGAILTDSTGGLTALETLTFESLSSASDIKLRVGLHANNPVSRVVDVSTTSTTNNVELLRFTLKAQGDRLWVDEIPVLFTEVGVANVNEIVSRAVLTLGSQTFTEASCSGNGTCTITFDDLDYTMSKDQTVTGVVSIDVKRQTGGFDDGDTIMADIGTTERGDMVVENSNGDSLAPGDRTGTATGEAMAFFDEGIMLSNFSTSTSLVFTAGAAAETSVRNYVVTFDAVAFGDDKFLVKASEDEAVDGAGDDDEGVVYAVLAAGAGDYTDVANPSAILECISGCGQSALNTPTAFHLPEGQTERYRLTVTVTGDGTPVTDSYKVYLVSVNWDADGASGDEFYTFDLGEDSPSDTGYAIITAL